MDSLDVPAAPAALTPVFGTQRPPRIWKFWGTALWGLFIFAGMFVGQIGVVTWFVLRREGPIDIAASVHVVGGGLTISLSVIMGLPAVLAALWIAIRISRTPFADYLALRWPSWTDLAIGVVALIVLVMGWDLLSRATGREIAPGFMGEVLNSARADGSLWLMVIAFVVAAPISEEFFLYAAFSTVAGRNRFSDRSAVSSCRRWCGPRCICNTTGTFSAKCFRSACCSVISATALIRPGSR